MVNQMITNKQKNDCVHFNAAIRIAADYHRNDLRRDGSPYMLHLIRVMNRVDSIDEKMVAILHDILDFRFYSADERLRVQMRRGKCAWEVEIQKEIDTPLGVTFKDILFDGVRLCGAKCIFCFVDQLPTGLRKSLYLKDDDYRLSFLHGNFVTLANATDEDIARIATQRLSPLYVAVHTTDHALRTKMLGRDAPNILDQMDVLARGRVTLHTQIVLCPGINDGDHLTRTVEDLAARHPTVASIAIVPAGLTRHRRNKTPMGAIDAQVARGILYNLRRWQARFAQEKATRLIWASDEFYLVAGRRVPGSASYEGFPQIENGVGLVRKFKDSSYRARHILPERLARRLRVTLVTGQMAAPLLHAWTDTVPCANLQMDVVPVTNKLFGETVTVAGLIGGEDTIETLRATDVGDVVFVPSVALREGTFLDDVTIADLEMELRVPVVSVEPLPHALARSILKLSSRRIS